MKRSFGVLNVVLVLLVCLCLAEPIWAATYPVYIDGELAEQAIERNGSIYMPMRTLFESCGATVNWDAKEHVITSVRKDGVKLTLDMRNNTAALTEQGQTTDLAMPQKGFIQNGVTYLPLRFVAENLSCRVKWNSDEKYVTVQNFITEFTDANGQVYVVNASNGKFYKGAGEAAVYIADCGLTSLAERKNTYDAFDPDKDGYSIPQWQVSVTPKGNYLLTCDYILMGGTTHSVKFAAYVSPGSGRLICNASSDRLFIQTEDTISLTDWDGQLVLIDEVAGQIKKYDLVTMLADKSIENELSSVDPIAVDGNYVFCSTNHRYNLLLLNLADGSLTDMKDALLTDEIIEKVSTATGHTAGDWWWQNFGSDEYFVNSGPYFRFEKIADGMLYVSLQEEGRRVDIPLTYKYR